MSLVFEALKKKQGAPASAVGVAPAAPLASAGVSVRPAAVAAAPAAWSSLLAAMLAGLALAGIGAALYGAGRTSGAAQAPEHRAAAAPAPVPTRDVIERASAADRAPAAADVKPSLAAVAVSRLPAPAAPAAAPVAKPAAAMTAVAAAPAITAATPARVVVAALAPVAAAPVTAVAAPAPVPVAAPAPALKALVNTQVQISTQPSPFDVREAFQSFLRQTQMRQWSGAQRAADEISAALGSGHVMALRAQAYLALQQDDLPRARSQYLQLQQALPEDREAGLNLALIEWRSGDRDAAANRLVGLVQRFPNDPQIQALSQNVRAQ
jgi:hypothetical protein